MSEKSLNAIIFYREHPKQQPCRYTTALSTYSTTTPPSRHIRYTVYRIYNSSFNIFNNNTTKQTYQVYSLQDIQQLFLTYSTTTASSRHIRYTVYRIYNSSFSIFNNNKPQQIYQVYSLQDIQQLFQHIQQQQQHHPVDMSGIQFTGYTTAISTYSTATYTPSVDISGIQCISLRTQLCLESNYFILLNQLILYIN